MKLRKLLAIFLCLIFMISLYGCSASAPENTGNSMAADRYYDAESGLVTEKPATSVNQLPENRKLIQKIRLRAETEEMDELLKAVNDRIAELGGYIENQEIYNGSAYSGIRRRNAELTIRIPADKLDSFVDQVAAVSNIVSTNKTTEDVTLSYVATESRVKALETEQERLLELLAKAETMEDLLTVESRLTDVRAELEQVTTALRVMENQVDYGTVYLSISEVREYTVVEEPETVWDRIGTGFMESLKTIGEGFVELFVFITVNFPYFVILGIVLTALILVLRHRKKKVKKDNTP